MRLSPSEIIGQVACVSGVTAPAITGGRRTSAVCRARFLAVAAIHEVWPWFSMYELAAAVGRGDHGTAVNAIRQTQRLMSTDTEFRAQAEALGIVCKTSAL